MPATYPRNFTYLQVTMRDKEYANLLSAIPAANVFIESSLDAHGKILVHCKGGRSRSAAFISAFIMSTRRLLFDEAFQMVKSKAYIFHVRHYFKKKIKLKEKIYKKKRAKKISFLKLLVIINGKY